MNKVYELHEISDLIKLNLPNMKFQVNGEVSQPKPSHGHLYFNLKKGDVCLRCIIWKTKLASIDCEVNEGSSIIVEGKLDFYGLNSSISFIVSNVLKNDGLGPLYQQYEQIKKDFQTKGYFDNKKPLPPVIKSILIITSEEGAALQDFIHTLESNNTILNYDLIDVPVQGLACPGQICKTLKKIFKSDEYIRSYDLIVITRGGGSFQDLFGFSQPELIEMVHTRTIPVLSAIGHKVDNPLLDLVADVSAPTPSLAAQLIVDHNKAYIQEFLSIKQVIKKDIIDNLYKNLNQLNSLLTNVNKINPINELIKYRDELRNNIIKNLNEMNIQLIGFEHKLVDSDNIVLYYNDKQIMEPDDLDLINGPVKMVWKGKEFLINKIKYN